MEGLLNRREEIERFREWSDFIGGDRFSVGWLLLLVLVVVWPVVFRGHVLVPGGIHRELGGAAQADVPPEFPRLGDIHHYFVPKLQLQFGGDHESWNATWNPHVQMGRPASHFGGYGKAYPLTYLLSFVTRDPYRLHALLGIATLTLLTLAGYLFLRSQGLVAPAALIGAVGIGLTTRSVFWIGFSQFLAWALWSLAILWLVVLWTRCRRFFVAWGLVFCCYCLAIGARHQATLRAAYLVVPVVLVTILLAEKGTKGRLTRTVELGAALLMAGVLALPLVHDLAGTLGASVRMASDTTDFIRLARKPVLDEVLPTLWNTFSFGNPSYPDYPLGISGLDFNPFFAGLLVLSFFVGLPVRAHPFRVVFGVFLALVLFEPVHSFAVRYLGLGFSRGNPTGGLYLPGFVLCAFTVDRFLRAPESEIRLRVRGLLVVVATTLGGTGLVLRAPASDHLVPGFLSVGWALGAAAAAFVWWRKPWILHVTGLALAASFSSWALVHGPHESPAPTPLVESIEKATSGGYRYARKGRMRALAPNLEVVAGLRSVHSYDSLASRSYSRWVLSTFGQETQTFGRHFASIRRLDVGSDAWTFTGIRALLSRRAHELDGWEALDLDEGYWLHVLDAEPRLLARVRDYSVAGEGALVSGRLEERSLPERVEVVRERDDLLQLQLAPREQETLLFVSRQYHRDWRALGQGRRLETLRVNGFYLGILVPASVSEVSLRFLPWARWAWVPLVLLGLSLLVGVVLCRPWSRRVAAEGTMADTDGKLD